jgi:uracil-DNA glycosylase
LENNNFLPTKENVFRCFKYFEIEETRIVILGQDPYPNKIDACGLSFSVERNNKLPKSLNNIFAELQRDKNIIKKDGDLKP